MASFISTSGYPVIKRYPLVEIFFYPLPIFFFVFLPQKYLFCDYTNKTNKILIYQTKMNMKKFLLTVAVFIACVGAAQAQTVSQVIEQFKNEKNVSVVNIPKNLMKLGINTDNIQIDKDIAENIDQLQVLSIGKITPAVKNKFLKAVKGLKTDGYEDVVKANDGDEKAHILVKTVDNIVKSVLIIAVEKDECSLVCIDGSITPEALKKLTE